jgi:hypothetical protein
MFVQKSIGLVAVLLLFAPSGLFARENSLTLGLTSSFDYDDRQTEPKEATDPLSPAADQGDGDDEDYRRLALTPLFQLVSTGSADRFELRLSPSAKYDLIEEETDWDNSFFLSAQRSLTRDWQLTASDTFLRSDAQDSQASSNAANQTAGQDSSRQLSSDPGRQRYWRNLVNLASNYSYHEDSLLGLSFDHTILRNDDAELFGYQDYDRYSVNLKNDHRYNHRWKTVSAISYIRGEYPTEDPTTAADTTASVATKAVDNDSLSDNVQEYRLLAGLQNTSFRHDTLSLNYDYIGARYDEVLQDDSDIHQLQLTWRQDLSSQLKTTIGAGPSYEKTEERQANWGSNGILSVDYAIRQASFAFAVEKRFDVENFSGTDERGFVDYWDTRCSFTYQPFSTFTVNGRLIYRYEDRQEASEISPAGTASAALAAGETTTLEEYHNDRYTAGFGLRYSFWNFYSAGLDYTFTKLESERVGDDYDDHRLLLSLSWKQEWLRW